MKTLKPLVFCLILAAVFIAIAPRTARADVSFDFFYQSLEPYGEWIDVPDYGYCWHPSTVDEDWAPYSDGYWAYTDAGWTWVSYEDWGAITYHYGRWMLLEGTGWCWVPDNEWGPAWVSWRSSDDYVGWAPLPPEVHFVADVGISVWVDSYYGIGPGYYNFCRYRDFGSPALRAVILNRNQNAAIINNTVNITNITLNTSRNLVFNGGPNFRSVSRRTAHPIQRLNLVRQTDPAVAQAGGHGLFARQQGNQLVVFAPKVASPVEKLRPQKIARSIEPNAFRVDKGWNKLQQSQVDQLQTKFKADTGDRTPDTLHARPVTTGELKVITEMPRTRSLQPQPTVPGVTDNANPAGGPARNFQIQSTDTAQPTPPVSKGRFKRDIPGVTVQPAPAPSVGKNIQRDISNGSLGQPTPTPHVERNIQRDIPKQPFVRQTPPPQPVHIQQQIRQQPQPPPSKGRPLTKEELDKLQGH